MKKFLFPFFSNFWLELQNIQKCNMILCAIEQSNR